MLPSDSSDVRPQILLLHEITYEYLLYIYFSLELPTFLHIYFLGNSVMVFKAIFNNILAISWLSVLLVEETGVRGENHRPAASH